MLALISSLFPLPSSRKEKKKFRDLPMTLNPEDSDPREPLASESFTESKRLKVRRPFKPHAP